MIYMFDTNIISYLIRGSSLALKTRFENEAPENLAVSVVVYAEILYGIRKISGAKVASKIKAFLENMRIVDFKANAATIQSIPIHFPPSLKPVFQAKAFYFGKMPDTMRYQYRSLRHCGGRYQHIHIVAGRTGFFKFRPYIRVHNRGIGFEIHDTHIRQKCLDF